MSLRTRDITLTTTEYGTYQTDLNTNTKAIICADVRINSNQHTYNVTPHAYNGKWVLQVYSSYGPSGALEVVANKQLVATITYLDFG